MTGKRKALLIVFALLGSVAVASVAWTQDDGPPAPEDDPMLSPACADARILVSMNGTALVSIAVSMVEAGQSDTVPMDNTAQVESYVGTFLNTLRNYRAAIEAQAEKCPGPASDGP